MPASPVFELDVPAPYDTFFVNGEKALSVSASFGTAAPRTNYYLSRWADLEGGEYILRVLAHESSSWATSVTKGNARVFFYTARGAGPHVASLFFPRGRQRIDILLSNLALSGGSAAVAFSLWRQGKLIYASEGSSWAFDTVPVADEDIPYPGDYRLALPVFSVMPNWANAIVERISYATEVLPSESDVEQRRSLRVSARRSFEASFARHSTIRSRIDTFLAGVGRNRVLLPIWHEQVYLTATLGSTITLSDLAMREFVAGGMAIVTQNDPALYEVLSISTINTTTGLVTFSGAPLGTWPAGSKLIPLRVARVSAQSEMSNLTDAVATASVAFDLDDVETSWFEPSWNTKERLFDFPLNRAVPISVGYERSTAFMLENAAGSVDVYDSDQKSRLTFRSAMTLRGRAQTFAFRQFIDMVRGRCVGFWLPTHNADLHPSTTSISGTWLDVKSIGLADYLKTDQSFRAIVLIEFKSDAVPTVYLPVESIEEISASVERVHFTEALPTVDTTLVKRVSFLSPVRFDQDSFELNHVVDASEVVQTSMVFRTVDDVEFFVNTVLTSLLYPLEVTESIDASSDVVQGSSAELVGHLDVTGEPVSGTLTVTIAYIGISSDPESFNVTGEPVSGTLTVVISYPEINSGLELIDVGGEPVSGTLTVVIGYIQHTIDPEGIDVSGEPVSGTLT
jgi:hypothetical protein